MRPAVEQRHLATAADLAIRVQDNGPEDALTAFADIPWRDVPSVVVALANLIRLDLPNPGEVWRENDLCSRNVHPMTVRNTRIEAGRYRRCRACDRDRAEAYRARKTRQFTREVAA